MNDIVERLRAGEACSEISSEYACGVKTAESGCQCAIAADEIERLRSNRSEQVLELRYHIEQQYAEIIRLQARVKKLEAALLKIASNKQQRADCFCGACVQARHARTALEEKA